MAQSSSLTQKTPRLNEHAYALPKTIFATGEKVREP